jgi:hypothetical protein
MKVVSYHSGIPPKNSSPEKPQILYNFIQGVNNNNDIGLNHHGMNIIDCDVAVLQGFVHPGSKNVPHLNLRKNVIETQKLVGKRTVVVDSNLFLFATKSKNQPGNYLRYSFDGVFRDTGFYFDTDVDPKRWQSISDTLDLKLKNYRTQGNHILVCLQRNNGWSMQGLDVMKFLHHLIPEIRKHSDRHIVVRGHPGDGKTNAYLKLNYPNVSISNDGKHITHDLKNAWATVVYNSSPGVASLIEGVPVFQMDANPNHSMYSECANTNLKRLENPKEFDRQSWLEKISMCHWSFNELASGEAWAFMRNYV